VFVIGNVTWKSQCQIRKKLVIFSKNARAMKLRRINRLARHAAPSGHAIFGLEKVSLKGELDYIRACIEEVEFDSDVVEPWFSEFDFSMLNRFNNDRVAYGYEFRRVHDWFDRSVNNREVYVHNVAGTLMDHVRFDVLWLSPRVFVTLHKFEDRNRLVDHLYTVQAPVNKVTLNLQAYRLSTVGQGEVEPAPALPLLFFAHLLAPILNVVPSIRISASIPPPTDTIIALVPTTAQRILKPITIILVNPTADLLRALALHPVHSRVILHLEEYRDPMKAPERNDLLREFQRPVHLRVPYALLDYDGESCTANPAFESLSIVSDGTAPLSAKMIDGIVRNPKTCHLTVESSDWLNRHYAVTPEWMVDLFCRVLQGNSSSLFHLTLVSRYNCFDFGADYQALQKWQNAFEWLTHEICSNSIPSHGVSIFHFAFPESPCKPLINSNALWDCWFSPSLV
jgi:hypothetical protein